MLPDFPVQKAKLMKLFDRYFERKREEYLGYFSGIPSYANHEGDHWSIKKENGTVSESAYVPIEAGFSLRHDEIPHLTIDKILVKLDEAAQEMAKHQVQRIFQEINKATQESGRSIDAKGAPLTKELLLQAFESMEYDFDQNRNPIFPALMMHPTVWEKYKDKMKSWEQDSDFKESLERMVERKREAWRDRESRRKLVD